MGNAGVIFLTMKASLTICTLLKSQQNLIIQKSQTNHNSPLMQQEVGLAFCLNVIWTYQKHLKKHFLLSTCYFHDCCGKRVLFTL